jgi:DNA-binding NarL/FixJ family response regulator
MIAPLSALTDPGPSDASAPGWATDSALGLAEHRVRLATSSAGDSEARGRRVSRAADLANGGLLGAAARELDAVIAHDLADSVTGRALLWRSRIGDLDHRRRVRLLELVLHRGGEDTELRAKALELLGLEIAEAGGQLPAASGTVNAAVTLADSAGADQAARSATATLALIDALRGRAGALTPEPAHRDQMCATPSIISTDLRMVDASRRLWRGDAAQAHRIACRLEAESRQARRPFARVRALGLIADAELRLGRWDDADRHARAGALQARDAGDTRTWLTLGSLMLLVAAHRGQDANDDSDAREPEIEWLERERCVDVVIRERWAAGLRDLAHARPASAAVPLAAAAQMLASIGIEEPGAFPLIPDAIEALLGAGEVEHAEALTERLCSQAADQPHPWAEAAAHRATALLALALADDKLDRAIRQLESAARAFQSLEHPFEQARTELLLGCALRRTGQRRRAAETLNAAGSRFQQLGATTWAHRCADEHACSGQHRNDNQQLTPAERRVAALIAAGHSNQEIANHLCVRITTIESHLTHIYRKLNIRSRTQLARRASTGGPRGNLKEMPWPTRPHAFAQPAAVSPTADRARHA